MDALGLSNLLMMGIGLSGSLAGSFAGYAASSAEAEKNRYFQSQQAQLQREWMEYMSSTAHQREVADLKAAGLNPILSASSGGASTPSAGGVPVGSTAHVADMSRIAIDALNAASQAKVAESQKLLNTAQAAKFQSETDFNTQSLQDRLNIEKERLWELNSIINLNRSKHYLNADQAAKVRKEWEIVSQNVKILQGKVHEQTIRNNLLEKENSWYNVTSTAKVAKDFATAGKNAVDIINPIKKLIPSK